MAKKKKDSKKNQALSKMRKTNKLPAMWFDNVLGPKSLSPWFSGETMLWTPAIHVWKKRTNLLSSSNSQA
jgi:hypothetical protein